MTEQPPPITPVLDGVTYGLTHDCSTEQPKLATYDGPLPSFQSWTCTCGTAWVSRRLMQQGGPVAAVWFEAEPTTGREAP